MNLNTSFNQGSIVFWIQELISDGIARCAVPLFMLFSSYLLFFKQISFKQTLIKQTKTLLIPYFLWCLINFLLIVFFRVFIQKQDFHSLVMYTWDIRDWICAFLGYSRRTKINLFSNYSVYAGEFASQLWFIRDLFILILFSPLKKKCMKNASIKFFLYRVFFIYAILDLYLLWDRHFSFLY